MPHKEPKPAHEAQPGGAMYWDPADPEQAVQAEMVITVANARAGGMILNFDGTDASVPGVQMHLTFTGRPAQDIVDVGMIAEQQSNYVGAALMATAVAMQNLLGTVPKDVRLQMLANLNTAVLSQD